MHFHVWTFLLQIVNFVALAYVLYRVLYRPLHEAIDRRRDETSRAQAEAEESRRQAVALEEQLQSELAEQTRRREELLHLARDESAQERKRLLDEAAQTAERKAREAQERLEQESRQATEALRGELTGLAVDLARRLLTQVADSTLNGQLAARLVASLEALPSGERQRLHADWRRGDPAVLRTAQPLDPRNVEKLSAAVAALVGQPVALDVEIDQKLISGVSLQLGGRVWDASLAGSLDHSLAPEENGAAAEVLHHA